jgi:Skp family chaperone for outer membrane proteins
MLPVRYLGAAIVSVLFLAALFVGAWGYGWLPGSQKNAMAGGVAVIDIEAVAKQLGADATLGKQIKDAETSLNSQLGSLQASFRKQYKDKSRELLASRDNRALPPADATAAKEQLAELEKRLNLQLLQAQQNAQGKFNAYRGRLVQDFRGEVVPVAKKIASQYGCAVVLTKNDAVLLAFDEAHDITSAVVEELRKNRPVANEQQASTAARSEQSSPLR